MNPLKMFQTAQASPKGMDLSDKLLMLSQTGMVSLVFYNHMLSSFTEPHWQAGFELKDKKRGFEVSIKGENSSTPEEAVDSLIAKMQSVKALPGT